MVHAITILKCKRNHTLPISFDSNECGCHHNGKSCIIITCNECLKEAIDNKYDFDKSNFESITIPLDEEGMKELKRLTQLS